MRKLGDGSTVYLSVVAESVVDRLTQLGNDESALVRREMGSRRDRWLPALREKISDGSDVALPAARCLTKLGLLRTFRNCVASASEGSTILTLGGAWPGVWPRQVFVEDQGRVVIEIGSRRIEGTSIRRKVLTMLCFLLTRPRFSSTRDEVLDALWPESEPGVALNSLNQTIYFLRRVFEPSYREDMSPGYLRHESDVVWLDRSWSVRGTQLCSDYIRTLGPGHRRKRCAAASPCTGLNSRSISRTRSGL